MLHWIERHEHVLGSRDEVIPMALRRSIQLASVCLFLLASTGCMTAGVNSPAERAGPLRSDAGAIWFWGITDAVK